MYLSLQSLCNLSLLNSNCSSIYFVYKYLTLLPILVECSTTNLKDSGIDIGSNDKDRYYVNDNSTYECVTGYNKIGEDVIICGDDGKWTSEESCVKPGMYYIIST